MALEHVTLFQELSTSAIAWQQGADYAQQALEQAQQSFVLKILFLKANLFFFKAALPPA